MSRRVTVVAADTGEGECFEDAKCEGGLKSEVSELSSLVEICLNLRTTAERSAMERVKY